MSLSLLGLGIIERSKELCAELAGLPVEEQIEVLNEIRQALHKAGPMRDEPVDCILWVKSETVEANDYNPNKVAPTEMKLLDLSISKDGYTQPIVTWAIEDGKSEVIDGFHRNRVGKESKAVRKRTHGYLPVTIINEDRRDRNDRIAATIRHNRARGKHQVQAMSEIVMELKRRNWSDERIGKELGMEADEVLRLAQISGLAETFADREFSQAWEIVENG
jgi:ParB-like chromosome segregation protein Spo0J